MSSLDFPNLVNNASAFTLAQPQTLCHFLFLFTISEHNRVLTPHLSFPSQLPALHLRPCELASKLLSQAPDGSPPPALPSLQRVHLRYCVNLPQGALTTLFSTQVSSASPIAFLIKSMCLFLALKALYDWYQPS